MAFQPNMAFQPSKPSFFQETMVFHIEPGENPGDRHRPTPPSQPFSGPRGEPVPAPPFAVAAPTSAVP